MGASVKKLQALQDNLVTPTYPAYYGGVVSVAETGSDARDVPAYTYTDPVTFKTKTIPAHTMGDLNGVSNIPAAVYIHFKAYVAATVGAHALIVETGNPQVPLAVASMLRGEDGKLVYVSQVPHLSAATAGVADSHWHITDIVACSDEYTAAAQEIRTAPGSSETKGVLQEEKLVIKERVHFDLIKHSTLPVYSMGPKRLDRLFALPMPGRALCETTLRHRIPKFDEEVGPACDPSAKLLRPSALLCYTYSVSVVRAEGRRSPPSLIIDAPRSVGGHATSVVSPRTAVGRAEA